jgi:hypothetical protein
MHFDRTKLQGYQLMTRMTHPSEMSQPIWIDAEAMVTACRYQAARLNPLTLGIASDANSFVISFAYVAQGKNFSADFTSPVYIAQGELFPISYNAFNPRQNTRSQYAPTTRNLLLPLGMGASILISLVYLTAMRGCA